MSSRCFVAAVLAFVSLGLAACGGGDDEGQVPEPTAAETVEQPTPATVATRASTPTITGNLFEHEDGGYSVEFPEGWTPRPNFLPVPGASVDAFFAPDEIAGIQPNIAVTCESVPEDMTLRDYLDKRMDIVRQVIRVEPEVSSREVAGQEALQFRFEREAEEEIFLEKTEVVLLTDKCGWDIALTVPLGDEPGYQTVFDEFLDSFRFLP